MRKVDVEIYPGMPTPERKEAVRAAAGNRTIARLATFWRAVEALARDDGPAASGWASLAVADTREGPVRVVRLKGRKPIGADWDVPTLLIDAILQIELVRPFWPNVALTADIGVATPHQQVRQVVDRSYSKRHMSNPRNLRDVHAIICREARRHAPGRALVVAQLDTETALPEIGLLPVNIELAHHNAIAGRDAWGPGQGRAGVALLIVVGRTAPSPVAVERIAEALTGAAIAPLDGWYETGDAARELADGTALPAQVDRHPHPVADAIRWQIAEGELVQIIGRARGVNRTAADPVQILVMTDTSLPIPIAQTLHAADLTPSPKDMMMAAGGVALGNPTDMAAAYPDLWRTREAAKSAAARSAAPILGAKSDRYILIRKRTQDRTAQHFLTRADYQLPGHGRRPSAAWCDPNLVPDPAAWLMKRIGPVVWCKLAAELPPPIAGAPAVAPPAPLPDTPALAAAPVPPDGYGKRLPVDALFPLVPAGAGVDGIAGLWRLPDGRMVTIPAWRPPDGSTHGAHIADRAAGLAMALGP